MVYIISNLAIVVIMTPQKHYLSDLTCK